MARSSPFEWWDLEFKVFSADPVERRDKSPLIIIIFIAVVAGLPIFIHYALQFQDLTLFLNSTQFALVLLGLSTIYGIIIIGLAKTAKEVYTILFGV